MLKCSQCSYITIYKQNLNRHILTKHGKEPSESEPEQKQAPLHKCTDCGYETTRSYNLKRHMVTNHDKRYETDKMSMLNQEKSPCLSIKRPCEHGKSPCLYSEKSTNKTPLFCSECKKTFTQMKTLDDHKKACRGVPCNVCAFCSKQFTSRKGRWNHEKICRSTAVIISQPISEPDHPTQATIQTQNIQTQQNANTINNVNNITNNIQIIAFSPDATKDGPLFIIPPNKKQEFIRKIRDITRTQNTPIAIEKAIIGLLEFEENRFLRKTDPKVGYTFVHTGDGQWEPHPDRRIYPKAIHKASADIKGVLDNAGGRLAPSSRFSTELNEFIGNAEQFIDDIPRQMTDEEKTTKRCMKDIEASLKMKAHIEYKTKGLPQ